MMSISLWGLPGSPTSSERRNIFLDLELYILCLIPLILFQAPAMRDWPRHSSVDLVARVDALFDHWLVLFGHCFQ